MQQQPLSGNQTSSVACPNCTQLIDASRKFCAYCGQQVAFCIHSNMLVRVNAKIPLKQQKCENCNEQLIVCLNPDCGRVVHTDMQICYFCRTPTASNPSIHNRSIGSPTLLSTVLSSLGQSEDTNRQVTSADEKDLSMPPTLSDLEQELVHLANYIANNRAGEYFPGDPQMKAKFIKEWAREITRSIKFTKLVKESDIRPELQERIRKQLNEVVQQLNFVRPYEVKLFGTTGAGKSTILAAMLGEHVIPRGFGGAITAVPLRFRLCKENEPEMMYVYFNDKKHQQLKFERSDWENKVDKYAVEPIKEIKLVNRSKLVPNENESHLVDYVEFALDPKTHAEFPAHVVLVDLPGSQAVEERHKATFDAQLKNVDAIILVTDSKRPSNEGVSEVLTKVKTELEQRETRRHSLISRMIFIIATFWDAAEKPRDLERATSNMAALAKELSSDYEEYHSCFYKDGQGNMQRCSFYPIRGNDAFWASMHLCQGAYVSSNTDQAQNYLRSIKQVFNQLKEIDSTLGNEPDSLHHRAMFEFSGLAKLQNDLYNFLAKSRFDVQLNSAQLGLRKVLDMLDGASWEALADLGVHVPIRSVKELEKALDDYNQGRQRRYRYAIHTRLDQMEPAWHKARKAYTNTIKNSEATFSQALNRSHENAAKLIKQWIDKGEFDSAVSDTEEQYHSLSGDEVSLNISLGQFTSNLRARFWEAIEAEMRRQSDDSPATALARAFLDPLEEQEKDGACLDLGHVSFGEIESRSELQVRYSNIKVRIKELAKQTCLSTIMSSLLSRHNILKQSDCEALQELKAFVERHSTQALLSDGDKAGLHSLMYKVLNDMVQDNVKDVKHAAPHYFRYELDQFLQCKAVVYDQGGSPHLQEQAGEFTSLVNDLRSEMEGYLRESEERHPQLYGRLSNMLDKDEGLINHWANIIKEIDRINATREQTVPAMAEIAAN